MAEFSCWFCGGTEFDWSTPRSRWVLGFWALAAQKKLRCRACGNISDPPPVTLSVPPGWHADPYGERRLRWWDGQQWTGHTAD